MKKRESFNNKWGFILACIGSAVGMGNIWMFPTRVSIYGGGSYLIPYFIFVVLIGFTGVIGEMSFGRATRSGPIDAFGIAMEKKGKRKLGELLGGIACARRTGNGHRIHGRQGWILKYCRSFHRKHTVTGGYRRLCFKLRRRHLHWQQCMADHCTCHRNHHPYVRRGQRY